MNYTIDIETRSLHNIKSKVYTLSVYTQIILISLCDEDFNTLHWDIWSNDLANMHKIREIIADPDNIIFAHNGLRFDFILLERLLNATIPNAIDTLSLFSPYLNAKVRSLKAIAAQFGREKNKSGEDMIKLYSQPLFGRYMGDEESFEEYLKRVKKQSYGVCFRDIGGDKDTYIQYCIDDTIELMHLLKRIPYNLDLRMYNIDKAINYRGINIDLFFTRKLVKEAAYITEKTINECGVSRAVLQSPAKLKKLFALRYNYTLESCKVDYLEQLVEKDIPGANILNARMQLSKNCASKALAFLREQILGRVFNHMSIDTAHTGRWQSPRANFFNMDKDKKNKAWVLYDRLTNGEHLDSTKDIMVLSRLCIVPTGRTKFYICDFSGIEARIASWVADDFGKLSKYEKGFDFYKELAAYFYNVNMEDVTSEQRSLGKVAVLGCGYGMGYERFISYAALSGVIVDEDESKGIINAWRDKNSKIAGVRNGKIWEGHILRDGGLWKELQNAFMDCILGVKERVSVAKCSVLKVGKDIHLTLPSDRVLFYRDSCIKLCKENEEDDTKTWAQLDGVDFTVSDLNDPYVKALRAEGYRLQIVFAGNHTLFGGKILENICQAICVDFLRHCIKKIDRIGLKVVLHIYDEICTEVNNETDAEKIKEIMSINPDWAEGFPLACEGFLSDRFAKNERREDGKN